MSADPLDKMLTPEEFLEWLGNGKSRRWLLDQAREKRIPAHKMGNTILFHPRTVLEKTSTATKKIWR